VDAKAGMHLLDADGELPRRTATYLSNEEPRNDFSMSGWKLPMNGSADRIADI